MGLAKLTENTTDFNFKHKAVVAVEATLNTSSKLASEACGLNIERK